MLRTRGDRGRRWRRIDSILRQEDEAASSAMVYRPDGVEKTFRSMFGSGGGGGRCPSASGEWLGPWTTFSGGPEVRNESVPLPGIDFFYFK
jgi:hypothetical protein